MRRSLVLLEFNGQVDLAEFSRCLQRPTTAVGSCWNGNAVLKAQSKERLKVPHLSRTPDMTDVTFDDFAGKQTDAARNRQILGLTQSEQFGVPLGNAHEKRILTCMAKLRS